MDWGSQGNSTYLIVFAGLGRSRQRVQGTGPKHRILRKLYIASLGSAALKAVSSIRSGWCSRAAHTHATIAPLKQFAVVTKRQTRSSFAGCADWLHEDWQDIKHLARLALAKLRAMPAAADTFFRAAWRSGTALIRLAILTTIAVVIVVGVVARQKLRSTRRGCADWLHEDWQDIRHLARLALAKLRAMPAAAGAFFRAARRGGAVFVRLAILTTTVVVIVVTVIARQKIRSTRRGCANWLHEDWQDIKHLARLTLATARDMPPATVSHVRAAMRKLANFRRSVALALRTSLAAMEAATRNGLEFSLYLVRSLIRATAALPVALVISLWKAGQFGIGALKTKRPRQQDHAASYRSFWIRNGLEQRRASIRYWRNRASRFVHSYASDTSAQEHFLNICVFLFGILIAAGGHLAIQYYSENRAQTDFERPGKEVVAFLTETIDNHVAVLETAQRRFTAKRRQPNRWQFFEFTRNTLKDLPGIQALEWVPRVSKKYRKRYEKRAIKDGLFGFRFFGPGGTRHVPANGEHYPIFYVEPYPGNEGALGFDLASEPAALESLHMARDSGKPVTTTFTPIDIGKKTGAKTGAAPIVVVVLPVYNTEILPFTTEERRKRITGFIRGVVRLDRMVQAYRSNLSVPPGLEVAFYSHGKNGKPQLRYHNPPLPGKTKALPYPKANESEDINLTAGFTIVDQTWSMVLRPESRLFLRNLSSAAWAFAIFAFLTTAILLMYLVTSQTRTRMIERSVAERTVELEAEIAQRKRIETELRVAKDEAVDANHAKSEFLAIMSHELRTPLNAITGFSEVMTNEVYGALGHKNYGDYVSFINDSANHLISLINDILDLSKIEAERYEMHKEVINLSEAWRPVEEMLSEQIAAAKVTFENRLADSSIFVRADDRALRQVFLNLLSNAIKFTPEGGRIETWAEFDETGHLLISVRDTGIGISEEDLELVFEPFKQVESKVARKHKGTGLGLPLTQRLVALHGGRVEIDSAPGIGTTVRIVLGPDAVVSDSNANDSAVQTGWGQSANSSYEHSHPVTARAVGEDINRGARSYAKG